PMTPAITATIVPASSALTMNGNAVNRSISVTGFSDGPACATALVISMSIAVMRRCFGKPDDHEPAVAGLQDFDRDPVEPAERRSRDHLRRRSDDRVTGAEIDDA